MNTKKNTPANSRNRDAASHDWLAPITADAPCGTDLEYDPEYVVLSAKTIAQPDAQYGNFVGSPEPVNWSDIDRDCRRLMLRSKDIRIAVLFTRVRTRLAGGDGFAEGMLLLANWLSIYPATIHPQLEIDTDRDAALEIRANAIQSLSDSDGLLSDLREIPLVKSTATRLQVRDVERAFARPRPVDALSHDSVRQQLDDLRRQTPAALTGFDQALASLGAIEAWCEQHLQSFAPDLSALGTLLALLAKPMESPATQSLTPHDPAVFETEVADVNALGGEPATDDAAPTLKSVESVQPVGSIQTSFTDRQAALERIREARHWFETHEPSSPIPMLLKRAEQFVGKRYTEIVHAIPPDLLAKWDAES